MSIQQVPKDPPAVRVEKKIRKVTRNARGLTPMQGEEIAKWKE